MRAVYIREHGKISDLRLSDILIPSPAEDEVLVRVEASGINPSDVGSVMGRFPQAVLPRVVGRDFAGRVIQGLPDLIGAEVWGSGGDLGITRDGSHAEYLALPRGAVSRRPKTVSAVQAAAAGVPFVTAFSALVTLGKVRQGEWVIVSGAAGAVGQAATQLAHARGARVVALIKDSGEMPLPVDAEVVAQSDLSNLAEVTTQATGGRGADLALNGVGGAISPAIMKALGVGGRQVLYSAAGGRELQLDAMEFYRNRLSLLGLDTGSLNAGACARILDELAPLFDSGALKPPVIGERYPMEKVAEAYAHAATGQPGKAVLLME